ncbi:MAG: RDD family protein [Acidimicrobiia bacterium]|nr:RDD family protein [Acidimicrobiia bacterium]MDH5292170.1 RDD family protein [Acidimicrobiia bacterium]MDH5422577.1 RDD family protein [Acidimicrobiia bacterium]MDH5518916.1 RDD family protein [Acidimicrobiia bacterium]
MTTSAGRRVVTGHYAGPATRALAAIIDAAASSSLFALGSSAVAWVGRAIVGIDMTTNGSGPIWLGIAFVWFFLYYWIGLALVGKTVGKVVIGLRVVARDGSPLAPRKAALRVIVMPISYGFFGLGLVGAVIGRERRTLHDVAAGSAEVYDWGGRSAELPTVLSTWLDRRTPVEPVTGERSEDRNAVD